MKHLAENPTMLLDQQQYGNPVDFGPDPTMLSELKSPAVLAEERSNAIPAYEEHVNKRVL